MRENDTSEAVDLHASVTNQSEGEQTAVDTVGTEPETGEGGEAPTATSGMESVPGYELPTPEAAERALASESETLSDIGVASFGVQEVVIGTDDRVRISPANSYPWRVHASLLITAADGSRWLGTAWFVGPHTLMTAGHCVFIKNSGVAGRDGWVRSIAVSPGRDAGSQPYGTVNSSNLRTVQGWANNANPDYDYGAIILPNDLGSTTGWLGAANLSDATLLASTANISGYPGDKPSGTQWYHARRVTAVNPRKVYYDVDTAGGQSGSAVYVIRSGGRYAVAVHAYGGASNSGTRINAPVLNNIVAWRA